MFMQFVRAAVAVITLGFKGKNGTRENTALPHGVPFSFHPASIDIHRENQEAVPLNGTLCTRCNRKVIGYHYSIWFTKDFGFYSGTHCVAKTETEARRWAEFLLSSGGVIGITEEDEELRPIPGVLISHIYQLCEAYEDELDPLSIPF